jgi:hypothetical protein
MLRNARRSSLILAMTGALAIATAAGAAASPVQDPVPIGPNEFFSGLVNGSDGITSTAVISTDCIGPIIQGETGHPLPGQTVEVELAQPPVSSAAGYTGNASSITAFLTWPASSASAPELVATFTSYYVAEAIPVTLTVPCGGSGEVSFVPVPTSTPSTGHPATVQVTFLSQP